MHRKLGIIQGLSQRLHELHELLQRPRQRTDGGDSLCGQAVQALGGGAAGPSAARPDEMTRASEYALHIIHETGCVTHGEAGRACRLCTRMRVVKVQVTKVRGFQLAS